MSMEEDLLMLIRRSPGVKELIADRASIDVRPQDTDEPSVVVSRINGGHDHMLSGSAGWGKPTMHVMCFAPRAVLANKLRDRVRSAVMGFSGVVGETNFGSITLEDEDHDYIPPIDANDRGTFSRLLVIDVLHSEAIPIFN